MTAKKILEVHGLHKTYWGDRIITAEVCNCFTEQDKKDAASWITCACGRVTASIPRHTVTNASIGAIENAPIDDELRTLGSQFYTHVYWDEFEEAAKCLIAIEKRAIVVHSQTEGIKS